MKLLVITSNPDRSSFRQRIGVYLDSLRSSGIDCQIAKLPAGLSARRKLFKMAADFDGAFLHKKLLNVLDAFWIRKYCKKIIYNFDDAVMYSDKNPQKDSASRLMPFRRTVSLADMIIVGSSYLAQHALKFNNHVEILPLGLRVKDYCLTPPAKTDDKIRLVWIGSKETLIYLEEIKDVLEEIARRFHNVVLRIISDDFKNIPTIPLEKRIWQEHTRTADLASCDIGLAPLPDNRFTRGKCSFKVLEYSASALPVVASPVGTNSIYVSDKITGFLVKEKNEWIDIISQLIMDKQLREKMGLEGREFAKKNDVSVIGVRLIKLITECLQGGTA